MSLASHKRAHFDYDILEKFEGGLALTGAEVKSAKAGHAQLSAAFLYLRGGELWLKNAIISPYGPAGEKAVHDSARDRKVLLHRRELNRLGGKLQTAGLTIVPISLYLRRNLVKLEFGLARGKKEFEKRAAIKKREVSREIRETMKS